MKLDIHVYHHFSEEGKRTERLLNELLKQGEKIMAKQDQAVAQLEAALTQIGKVRTEIEALKVAAEAAGDVQPALQDAIDRVVQSIGGLDDLNTDATG